MTPTIGRTLARAARRLLSLPALLLLAACSERPSAPSDQGEPGGEVREVVLSDFQFTPAALQVPAGTTVRFRTTTSTFHTITPDGHAAWQEIQVNAPGRTFDVLLAAPGTYDFFCNPHRALGMAATITVQ